MKGKVHFTTASTSKAAPKTMSAETMKVAEMTRLLAEEKQAREALEAKMYRMMIEAQKEALKQPADPKKKVKMAGPVACNSDSEDSVAESGGDGFVVCHSKKSGYSTRNPSRATRKATVKWYVVLVGRQIGIYNSWDRARKYTEGYSKARFRAFKDFREAKAFFKGMRGEKDSGCEYESDSESSAI